MTTKSLERFKGFFEQALLEDESLREADVHELLDSALAQGVAFELLKTIQAGVARLHSAKELAGMS